MREYGSVSIPQEASSQRCGRAKSESDQFGGLMKVSAWWTALVNVLKKQKE
jgi:hypothetical protein